MNQEQEIKILKQQVSDLMTWKEQRVKQQITFPLDIQSIDVLNKYFMRIIGNYVYEAGATANVFLVYEGTQGNIRFDAGLSLIEYVADASTDIVTIKNPNSQTLFYNNQTVVLFTTDTEPAGLSGLGTTTYYIVNATSTGSFKLSATSGGAAINITSNGIGRQFLTRV